MKKDELFESIEKLLESIIKLKETTTNKDKRENEGKERHLLEQKN